MTPYKAYKVVRNLDEMGRILIPQEMRDSLGWEDQDYIDITFVKSGELVMLTKTIYFGEDENDA